MFGRTRSRNRRTIGARARLGVLSLQGSKPHRRQRSSSPVCPLLRLLQIACSRRSLLVLSPQPLIVCSTVVQETESAGTDLKDDAYGGLLLKATPL